MSIQARLLDLVEVSRRIEEEFVADVDVEGGPAGGSLDRWSVKDVIAHVAEWRRRGAFDLSAALRGEVIEDVEEFDEANRGIFEQFKDLPWEEVLDRSRLSWEAFREFLETVSDDQLRSAASTGGRHPLWRRVTVEATTHPLQHFSAHAHDHGRTALARGWVEGLTGQLLDLDPSPEWHGVVHYNLACHFTRIGQAETAFGSLETALGHRPDLKEWASKDPDLESLRANPRFLNLTQT